jgi:predicted SnoaL-like aldol condensation-catalyzing enzyme
MKFSIITLLLIILIACNSETKQVVTANLSASNMAEKNRALIRKVYSEMVNKHQMNLLDSFFSPDIVDHSALKGQQQGREGFKKAVAAFLSLFAKVEVSLHEELAEGEIVATRETWNVVLAANNKPLSGETMHFFKIRDGLITDEWSKGWEWLGL